MEWTWCTGATWGGVTVNGVVRFGQQIERRVVRFDGDTVSLSVGTRPYRVAVSLAIRNALAPLEMLLLGGTGNLVVGYKTEAGVSRLRLFEDVLWGGHRMSEVMAPGESGPTPVVVLDGEINIGNRDLDDVIVDSVA